MNFKKIIPILICVFVFLSLPCISVSAKEEYTITTATDIQKHLANLITLTEEKQKEYDFNNDGILNIIDSTRLRYRLAGIEKEPEPTTPSEPESVSLSVTSKELKVGQDFVISGQTDIESYNSFTWSSSNPSVATVTKTTDNQATIQPKMQGTANITIKTGNGKTATCKVTVKGSIVKCLDVSTWQGDIDFKKVKSAGYNYVIMRAGFGRETYQKDNCFEQNYKKAKEAGLKVGAYWYAYATSKSEAIKEAETCLYCIGNKTFDLPIYYDVEESSMAMLSKTELTDLIDAFCNKIESSGHQAGVYASDGMYWNIDKDKLKKNYSTWLARIEGDFSGITDDIHQYTWVEKVNGISGNVDCSYIYNLNIIAP